MISKYRYIIFFFLLLGFVFIVRFNGLYGQDSYEYLRFTKCLGAFYRTGTNPGSFFWPLIYPIAGSLLSFLLNPIFALQLISIASFTGAAVYLDKTIDLIYPDKKTKNIFIFLFFLLSPYLLRASMVVMSDMLAVFFISGAYYYYNKYKAVMQGKYFFWFMAFAIAAISTRYAAIVLLVLPVLNICYTFLNHFKWKALVAALLVCLVIVTPHLLLRYNAPFAFVKHDWITQWSFANYFKDSFVTADGNANYSVYNIVYAFDNLFHPGYCFIGIVLLIAGAKYFKLKSNTTIIRASIVLYALFLAGIPLQNLRFLLLSFPLVAIIFFSAFDDIMHYLTEKGNFNRLKVITVYVLIAAIQIALFYRVFMSFYHDNKTERQIATEVLKYPSIPIYTFSIDGALQAYGANNRIINLYKVKLDTIPPIDGEKLFLFNEKQFSEDWKGQNPMTNWDYIQKNFKLNKIENLPEGWTLYNAQ